MFIGAIASVLMTSILVVPLDDGRQLTVYENAVHIGRFDGGRARTAPEPVAMVLPVPAGDHFEFVDMSGIGDGFFDALKPMLDWIPTFVMPADDGKLRALSAPPPELEVLQVGSYKCSLVPTIDDFVRLNTGVYGDIVPLTEVLVEHYATDFMFAVCMLGESALAHPLAYTHARAPADRLFVPTRHFHEHADGDTSIDWDHHVYGVDVPLVSEVCEMTYNVSDGRFASGNPYLMAYCTERVDEHFNDTALQLALAPLSHRIGAGLMPLASSLVGIRLTRSYPENHDLWLPVTRQTTTLMQPSSTGASTYHVFDMPFLHKTHDEAAHGEL